MTTQPQEPTPMDPETEWQHSWENLEHTLRHTLDEKHYDALYEAFVELREKLDRDAFVLVADTVEEKLFPHIYPGTQKP